MRRCIDWLRGVLVSELVVIGVIIVAASAYIASAESTTTFHLAIQPIPAPKISSVLGDPDHKSIVVLGTSKAKDAVINLYTVTDPSVVVTKTNSDGSFAVVFDQSSITPGSKIFTATAVVHGSYVTDPGNRVTVAVNSDYSVRTDIPVADVHIGNTDSVTSELISTISKGAQANKVTIPTSSLPETNSKKALSFRIQAFFFVVLFVQFFYLLLKRALRKQADGKSAFHIGKGFYPNTPVHSATKSA